MSARAHALLALALLAPGRCGGDSASDVPEVVFTVTAIEVEPRSHTFVALPPGQSERLDVVLRHGGNAGTITLGTIRFDPPTDVFGLVQPDLRALEPGQQAVARVVATPNDWDEALGRLTIAHDAPDQASPLVVELRVQQPEPLPVATPASLALGEIARCDDAAGEVVVSVGSARPVTVQACAFTEGCSPWFALADLPPLPLIVTADEPLRLSVRFAPREPGPHACELQVSFADQGAAPLRVPITASSPEPTRTGERFALPAPPDAEILFVLDASRDSLAPFVDRVVEGVQAISEALPEDLPLRLGVLGVDPRDTCPEAGRLLGDPPWVQGSDRAAIPLRARALMESGCDPSAREAPIDNLLAALGDAALHDADTPCTSEADCLAPDLCVAGACGGPNRGFVRSDGVLHVVIVSDEDDQSAAQASTLVARLRQLKDDDPWRAFVHVAGGGPEGCQAGTLEAAAAPRLADLVAQTMGAGADWCAPEWAAALIAGPPASVGAVTAFYLEGAPLPDTVEVSLNGEPCAEGWRYEAEANRVVVDLPGPCLPVAGDELSVSYVAACP